MASTITIDASEIFQLAQQLNGSARIVAEESKVAMERSALTVQNAARLNLHNQQAIDTGQLVNSIAREVKPFEARVGTNKTYGATVEHGRQPGAPMPPPGSLRGWMARHGIPAVLEYVIRRAISRRGIRARPYLLPALEDNRAAITKEFTAAHLRAVKRATA